MKITLKIVFILCLCLVVGYSIRGLWIKGIIVEKKTRLLSEYLDQSFSRIGLSPEDISHHFYEERRCGLRKFVHTTKIFNLPQEITADGFYHAILDAAGNSKAHFLENTKFEAGGYSISIFILGRRSISTHLLVGIKKKIKEKIVKKDKVAIIIDDLGYNMKVMDYIRQIKVPLTLAVLPRLSFSKEAAEEGHNLGHEIILHFPLEPEKEIECLGPGAVFLEMGPQEIESILDENLKTVPYCNGLNNHAGSRFTKDTEKMEVLLEILKKKKLFFVDSLVTPESCGFKLAGELGIPAASRDIFLDNIKEEKYILARLKELIEISRRTGSAIGIGHPSLITIKVLKENLSLYEDTIEFVHVSALLR